MKTSILGTKLTKLRHSFFCNRMSRQYKKYQSRRASKEKDNRRFDFSSALPTTVEDFAIPFTLKASVLDYNNYRTLKRNAYHPPLCRILCDPDDVPLCSCDPVTGCNSNCDNRIVFMECAPGYCKCLQTQFSSDAKSEYCGNMTIQSGNFPPTEIYVTPFCGFGLRVVDSVPANTIICEYLGEVITADECKHRIQQYKKGDDFYFAALQSGLVLDAKLCGSTARFANHSCDPSCEMQKWTVMGEPRIVLVSKRALQQDEAITYNYNYFDDGLENEMRMKRQKCCCGSSICSGTIGGRVNGNVPSPADHWTQKTQSILQGTKRISYASLCEHYNNGLKFIESNMDEKQDNDNFVTIVQQIQDLIQSCDVTRTAAIEYLDKKSQKSNGFQEKTVIQNVIDAAPRMIRLEEIELLEDLVKRHNNAESALNKLYHLTIKDAKQNIEDSSNYITVLDDKSAVISIISPTIDTVEETGTGIIPNSLYANPRLNQDNIDSKTMIFGTHAVVWEDLLAVITEVIDAYPMRVDFSELLMPLLQANFNWASSTLQKFGKEIAKDNHESMMIANNKSIRNQSRDESKSIHTIIPSSINTKDALSSSYDAEFRIINTFCSYYGLETTYDHCHDMKLLTSFLENGLELFLYRQLATGGNVTDNGDSCNDVQYSHSGKRRKGSSSKKALHCFCQLPEDDAEINVLICCDTCEQWYHPQCVNDNKLLVGTLFRDSTSKTQHPNNKTKGHKPSQPKRGEKSEKCIPSRHRDTKAMFVCPLCTHLSMEMCNFAWMPSDAAEWRISNKYAMQSALTNNSSSNSSNNRSHPSSSSSSSSIVVGLNTIARQSRIKSELSASQLFSFIPSDCISVDELSLLVHKEQQMSAIASPPGLLLGIVLENVKQWQRTVQQFFSSESVKRVLQEQQTHDIIRVLKSLHNPSINNHKDSLLLRKFQRQEYSEIVIEETRILQQCMQHYYELRVLKIVTPEVLQLRQLAWNLSTTSLFRTSIDIEKGGLFTAADIMKIREDVTKTQTGEKCQQLQSIEVEETTVDVKSKSKKKINFKQLQKLLHTGERLHCKESAIFVALELLKSEIIASASLALQCKTSEQTTMALEKLTRVSEIIDLDGEYCVARVHNLDLHYRNLSSGNRFLAKPNDNDNDNDNDNGDGIISTTTYCLCRGIDDGSEMIECDGCLEWFHVRCVGVGSVNVVRVKSASVTVSQSKRKKSKIENENEVHIDTTVANDELIESEVASKEENSQMQLSCLQLPTIETNLCDLFPQRLIGTTSTDIDSVSQLSTPNSDKYYCIACSELSLNDDLPGVVYPFAWPCNLTSAQPTSDKTRKRR